MSRMVFAQAALVAVAILLPGLASAQINMSSPAFYTTGIASPAAPGETDIRSVDVADIDLDGDVDVVVLDSFTAQVATLINDGSGVFSAGSNFATSGANPRGLSLVDLDANGFVDLVVASQSTNALEIYLGVGGGNFFPLGIQSVGAGPRSLKTGDVDGDGFVDVLSANFDGFSISVAFGDGAGGFHSRVDLPCGGQPNDFALGDFDRDGDLDLMVANFGFAPGSDNAAVLVNDGTGAFGAPITTLLGAFHSGVEVGDLDLDGDLDGIFSFFVNSPGNLGAFLGDGQGNFATGGIGVQGVHFNGIAKGDFDLDGDLDAFVVDVGDDTVAFFSNDLSSGSFLPSPALPMADTPQDPQVADLNGDGLPDVVFAIREDNQIAVITNNGATASLPSALAASQVADGFGGAADILTVGGSSGGADRRVDLSLGQASVIAMAQPPLNPDPAAFMLWGQFHAPGQGLTPFVLPFGFGTSLVLPYQVDPGRGDLFLVANNFGIQDPQALVPSFGTPWGVNFNAAGVESYVVLQGLVEELPGQPRLTNAILLHTF
jgi:FG-GAP-like repeat